MMDRFYPAHTHTRVKENVRDGANALTVLVAKRPIRKAFENFMVAGR